VIIKGASTKSKRSPCDETISPARTNFGVAKALKMRLINEMLTHQKKE
jgi:hypothetical protein